MQFKRSIWIWFVLILALGLRLPHLNSSFWYEEAREIAFAMESGLFSSQLATQLQPQIFPLITRLSLSIVNSEWAVRLVVALIPALVSIYLLYKISAKLYSSKTGILASLFLATSSLHVFYSQEVGSYSLLTMICLLSWWMLLSAKTSKSLKVSIFGYKLILNKNFLWLTIITILGLYTNYLYLAVVLAQIFYVFFQRRRYVSQYIFTLAVSALAFLPQVTTFLKQLNYLKTTHQITPYFDTNLSQTPIKALLFIFGKFSFGLLNLNIGLVMIFGTVILLSILIFIFQAVNKKSLGEYILSLGFIRQKDDEHKVEALTTNLIGLFIPLMTVFVVSTTLNVFDPKHLLFTLPFFYLLIASAPFFTKRTIFSYLIVGLVLAINFYSISQYYFRDQLQRENWRGLQSEIAALYPVEKSVIIFSAQDEYEPWVLYDQQNYTTLTTGSDLVRESTDLKNSLKNMSDYQFILVFDYGRHQSDPADLVLKEVMRYGYEMVDIINYSGIGFVRVFAKQESLISNSYLLELE